MKPRIYIISLTTLMAILVVGICMGFGATPKKSVDLYTLRSIGTGEGVIYGGKAPVLGTQQEETAGPIQRIMPITPTGQDADSSEATFSGDMEPLVPGQSIKDNEDMQMVPRQRSQESSEVIPTVLYDLTGLYYGKPNGVYFIRQVGDQIYWFGENSKIAPMWANVAYGTIQNQMGIVNINWADVPRDRSMNLNSGTAELTISIQEGRIILVVTRQTGGFQTTEMTSNPEAFLAEKTIAYNFNSGDVKAPA